MAQGRDALVREALLIKRKTAADEQRLSDISEALRTDAREHKAGFTVKIEDLGEVSVSAPSEREFKGIAFVLDQEAFLDDLTKSARNRLLEKKIVTQVREYSTARAPSVTIRPLLP